MALVWADRIKETATCSGTSNPYTLLGAFTGAFKTFSSRISNAGTCIYVAVGETTGAWETGIGTYTASGNTLARTTVQTSSASDAAVNWTVETIDIFIDLTAASLTLLGGSPIFNQQTFGGF